MSHNATAMDLLPSQDAQFFKAPLPPLAQVVLDIVEQHILRDRLKRHGDCSCGVYVRQGKWQDHINSVVHPAVNAYITAITTKAAPGGVVAQPEDDR